MVPDSATPAKAWLIEATRDLLPQPFTGAYLSLVAVAMVALVLVTHSREFAERASRRLVLSGGVLSPA